MIIVSHNKGGTYIICNLDSTLSHAPIAAFQVIPYFPKQVLTIPDLKQLIDVSVTQLCKLEHDDEIDLDNPLQEEHLTEDPVTPDLLLSSPDSPER